VKGLEEKEKVEREGKTEVGEEIISRGTEN
jgi:hypothetical protein